jgi:methylmalonyl-CoA mutase cobalamin-binding subunit
VVATLAGHAQELDALVLAAVAASDGWRVTYVGPGVSPDDLVELLAHVGARVLAVSVAATTGDRLSSRELRRLRMLVPAAVELLVAPLSGLAMLRARLRALRDATSTRA